MTQADLDNSGTEPTVHHVPRRKKKRDLHAGTMTINLGPMIDVIFNLLIYFVVTANFAVGEGVLTLKMPQGTGAPTESIAPPQTPLNIVLSAVAPVGVDIRLQRERLGGSFEQLQAQLRALQFNDHNPRGVYKADNPVIIQPEGPVRWQHVVNAFNAAIAAEYSNISFAQAKQPEQ